MKKSVIHQSPLMYRHGNKIQLAAAVLLITIFVLGIKGADFILVPTITFLSMPLHIAIAEMGLPKSILSFTLSYLAVLASASVVYGAGMLIGQVF